MPSAEYDLRYLQAGIEVLEKYLLSSDIYWPAGVSPAVGEPAYPQLTLGGMLLALERVKARRLSGGEQAALEAVSQKLAEAHSQWRVAWGQKAAHEFRSRLNLWRNYLEEYRDNPKGNVNRYAYEVGRRAMLLLLQQDAEDLKPADVQLLDGLDRLLRGAFVPGEFVWDAELAGGFPKDVFWFLYGKPKMT